MGHLPIVNQETILNVIKEGYISTRGTLKKYIIKTTSDIFSDVLASRKGDLIFPWIIHGETGENIGFKYVFKIEGPPIFVEGDDYPVKIPLEPEGMEFDNPLSEAEALDLWDRKLLWNAIGKKSLGRGRSLTHQTPMEDAKMLELLNKKNPEGPKKITLGKEDLQGVQISINPSQGEWDEELHSKIKQTPEENRLSSLNLSGMQWRRGKYFTVEKTFEAWLMKNIDQESCKILREMMFDNNETIEWFGNYLPFGVQGGNIDVVILHSGKSGKTLTVIELKVGSANKSQFESAAEQSIDYSIFLKKAFNSFDIEVNINSIVLTGKSKQNDSLTPLTRDGLTPKWFTYNITEEGKVIFERML